MFISSLTQTYRTHKAEVEFEKSLKKQNFASSEDFLNHFQTYPNYIEKFKRYPNNFFNLMGYFVNNVTAQQTPKMLSFLEKHNFTITDNNGQTIFMNYALNMAASKTYAGDDWEDIFAFLNNKSSAPPTKSPLLKKLDLILNSTITDINHQNIDGDTTLMLLVKDSNFKLANYLLTASTNTPDTLLKNKLGQNVLDIRGPMVTQSPAIRSERVNPLESAFIEKVTVIMERQSLNATLSTPPQQCPSHEFNKSITRHKI